MRQDCEPQFDEAYVCEILAEAAKRRPRSRGQFDLFSRPYLAAGYAREVAEAERRYFRAGAS
jgi:hypothetical protein